MTRAPENENKGRTRDKSSQTFRGKINDLIHQNA